MDDIETELRQASEKLTALDQRRADQSAYRDHVIRKALDAGITWVRIQELSGLSPRGLQLAANRTKTK